MAGVIGVSSLVVQDCSLDVMSDDDDDGDDDDGEDHDDVGDSFQRDATGGSLARC